MSLPETSETERELEEDYETERVRDVNLFEYAMKSALKFKHSDRAGES